MLGLLSIKPEKKYKLVNYLKTKWNLSTDELKSAYQLQKKLMPDPYYDPEFESKGSASKEKTKSRK